MLVYHAEFKGDYDAEKFAHSILLAVRSHGGDIHVSRSFGSGPAVVVLSLPENIEVKAVTDQEFTPVEPVTVPETPTVPRDAEQPDSVEQPAQSDATDNWGGEFDL